MLDMDEVMLADGGGITSNIQSKKIGFVVCCTQGINTKRGCQLTLLFKTKIKQQGV